MVTPSPIQIYCTVKRNELEATGDGLICRRCQRVLHEIDPDQPAPPRGCGFIRMGRIPLIASSLALSSCIDPSKTPDLPPVPPSQENPSNEQREKMIVPGMIAPPNPEKPRLNKADYPIAERVIGRPKWIISPYTRKHVDVEGIPAGSLAIDPTSQIEEEKYFVIPPEAE